MTPGGAPGAIAVIGLFADQGDQLDDALHSIGGAGLAVGDVRLRKIAGIDTGLIVRWSETRADLFPHGGSAVLRGILARLDELGMKEDRQPDPRAVYVEAADELEARMLEALAHAASPRAVELLLDQPRLWGSETPESVDASVPSELRRLIDPPLVVAIGPPNIGKSSLANALAGRAAALVADEPGTTRDHVGLTLELDGLVVRYLDTPGMSDQPDADPLIAEAAGKAMDMARAADLVLACADAANPGATIRAPEGVQRLDVLLRADLASESQGVPGLRTSSRTGAGIGELALSVRRALVPDAALADPRPWRFWEPA